MTAKDIGALVNNQRQASAIKAEASQLPALDVQVHAQPITRTVLRVTLTLTANFDWVDRHHGGSEPWWIWVEDTENEHIYHKELYASPQPPARSPSWPPPHPQWPPSPPLQWPLPPPSALRHRASERPPHLKSQARVLPPRL